MPNPRPAAPLELSSLPLSHLAGFVGIFADRYVLTELERQGFGDLRRSHGFLVQHLLRGSHSVGELATRLGISQQAVSKTVGELTRAGYVETVTGTDARVRLVQLAERGRRAVQASRRSRQKLERTLKGALGAARYEQAQRALVQLLESLGGAAAIEQRRVPLDD